MIVLGIETSCDETAAAVVDGGVRVLSSVVASQHELHREYAGVVPEIASRAHVESILPVVREALSEAGVGLGMIDAVAVGNRPGLIGSLLVGVSAAKSLAWSLGKPLIGVDHVQAHLYSGLLVDEPQGSAAPQPDVFPAIGLVVSGGHTSLYSIESWRAITRLGGTIDDAMGEAFDKAATILGLPYPGGPNLDRLAQSPGANDRAHDFPVSRLAPGSLDFSFSGLKTAMLYAVRGVPTERGEYARSNADLTNESRRDLAASFQRAACKAIIVKLTRAVEQQRAAGKAPRAILVGGGATANSRLRAELHEFSRATGITLRLSPMRYCMDNAAMIAGLGTRLIESGQRSTVDLQAVPTTAV